MRRLAVCVLLLACLGACALTTDEVNLEYHSLAPQNTIVGANAIVVRVVASEGRISNLDKMSVKKNGYGMEMAPIISKQSLPDLVKSAVEQELAREGFQLGQGPVLVTLELNKFYNDFKMGFFSGAAASEVTVTAQVKTSDGRILYARNITGEADEGGVMIAGGDNAKISLEKALSNCVARLVSDPNFTQAVLAASRTGQAPTS